MRLTVGECCDLAGPLLLVLPPLKLAVAVTAGLGSTEWCAELGADEPRSFADAVASKKFAKVPFGTIPTDDGVDV